jgi:hypothetical protein
LLIPDKTGQRGHSLPALTLPRNAKLSERSVSANARSGAWLASREFLLSLHIAARAAHRPGFFMSRRNRPIVISSARRWSQSSTVSTPSASRGKPSQSVQLNDVGAVLRTVDLHSPQFRVQMALARADLECARAPAHRNWKSLRPPLSTAIPDIQTDRRQSGQADAQLWTRSRPAWAAPI